MTPEEIEAKRVADEAIIAAEIAANDPLKKLQEENAKLVEERENYKNVALKRLGKLPGDADFLNKDGNGELSVAEQVRLELLDREIANNQKAEKEEIERIKRENAELRLAAKNRPGSSIGGGSSENSSVKDNVFSEAQLVTMRARATKLKIDPEKYIQTAKENLMKRA